MSRIVLAVSGGIAAYKACFLCRALGAAGHEVRVVMTPGATHFVTPTTFQALSGEPVHTSIWDSDAAMGMGHIELARWAELVLIAPASADCMARLAQGRADDLLTTMCLVSEAPLTLAPAMNQSMWRHPATQANVALLRERGARILGPADGPLAEGESGPGRMLEPEQILAALEAGQPDVDLHGIKVVVSAGPTFEDIDPVRFLGNRSSGRMGFAVAAAMVEAGAEVTLVAGPVNLATPAGVAQRTDVRSAAQMLTAVLDAAAHADIVVAAAAVADYRAPERAAQKLKKSREATGLDLHLVENSDILATLGQREPRPFLVGFAAETGNLEAYARAKLERKGCDMIAANLVGTELGFDRPDNALELYWPGGGTSLPRQSKPRLAVRLVEEIGQRFKASRADMEKS